MPQNKRESLIFSFMMCFVMVLWMSIYNVSISLGGISMESIKIAWLGFPVAFSVALLLDLLIVSKIAKSVAFGLLLKPESSSTKKIMAVSSGMVIQMVVLMSVYGAIEICLRNGMWNQIAIYWLTNIPKNFIMALPFQLLIAGPVIRKVFRTFFPAGVIFGYF